MFKAKAFAKVFNNPNKNHGAVGLKDMSIGRPVKGQELDPTDESDFDDDGDFGEAVDDLGSQEAVNVLGTEKAVDDQGSDELSAGGAESTTKRPVEDGDQSSAKKRKQVHKAVLVPASRRARDKQEEEQDHDVTPRTTNPTNLIGEALNSMCPLRPQHNGSVSSCLHHSLGNSFPDLTPDERRVFKDECIFTLKTLVRANADVLHEGTLALLHYITEVFHRFPGLTGPDVAQRSGQFKLLTGRLDGQVFFQTMTKQLLDWTSSPQVTDEDKEKHPARAAATIACNNYKEKTNPSRRSTPFRQEKSWASDGMFLAQVSKGLSDLFLTHVFKFTVELKNRVRAKRRCCYGHVAII